MKPKSTLDCRYFLKRLTLLITIIGLFSVIVAAQDQSQSQGKTEATITMSYFKNADMRRTAVALVKAKVNGKFAPVKNVKVNFYLENDKTQKLLEFVKTDNKGHATILLQNDLPLDDSLYFTIIAKIEADPLYEDAQEQIHYTDANIILSLNPHDTTRLVTAKVTELGKDGKELPVNGAEVKFYVQRLFGIMPASEDYAVSTDEKGEASFTFPKIIPGDTAGSYTVVARMEDNAQFGNVETKAPTSWGTVLAVEKDPFPRALWEPYAPLPLVMTISILFGGVWFVYFYLFFQIWKIKKDPIETAKS